MDRHDLENISLDALSDFYTEKTGDQLNPLFFCLPRRSWQVWLDSCEEGKFYFTQAELDAAVCGKPHLKSARAGRYNPGSFVPLPGG